MTSMISNFVLAIGLHAVKNEALINNIDTFWITEELALHGRYSPYLLELQKAQDLKANLWSVTIFVWVVFITGLLLCACQSWLLQCLGIVVLLWTSSMFINIATATWRSYQSGVLLMKERV